MGTSGLSTGPVPGAQLDEKFTTYPVINRTVFRSNFCAVPVTLNKCTQIFNNLNFNVCTNSGTNQEPVSGGLRGLHIKAIHTSKDVLAFGEKYTEMLWNTGSQDSQSSLLWYDRNKIPWQFNQAYRWYLKHR